MIIWIASYPKSGNTWIRSLISSYLFSNNGIFNFSLLNNIERFSVNKTLLNLTSSSNYQNEVPKNWIKSQEIINEDKKTHFLKTHNAMCTINSNAFTNINNTRAAIYIVRDPRNIVTSLSNHYEISLDDSFNFMSNKKKIIFPLSTNNNHYEDGTPGDFNFLSDWSSHYNSWKNINFAAVKIIKYEDFIADPLNSFISVLEFLKKFQSFKIESKKVDNAIKSTKFEILKQMEESKGFNESVISLKSKKKIKFFNLGKNNNWNKLLDKQLIVKIENHFKREMIELGYL